MKNLSLFWLTNSMISGDEYEQICLDLMDQLPPTQRSNRRIWLAKLTTIAGVSLLIAAVIYFIASNWKGLAYGYKLGLVGGTTLLAYPFGHHLSTYRANYQLVIVCPWLLALWCFNCPNRSRVFNYR